MSQIEDLLGNQFINKNNKVLGLESLIKCKLIFVYFSAGYCPPCKKFTPILNELYNNWNNKNNDNKIEIIFCSCDKSEQDFNAYLANMDFLALPYGSEVVDKLAERFGVQGIPQLFILNNNGSLITKKGRNIIMEKGESAIEDWINL